MKYIAIVAALTFLLTAAPALSVQRSGNDLFVDCSKLITTKSMEEVPRNNVLGMGYCIGLIDGMVTFNYVYEAVLQGAGKNDFVQMCLPDRISTRELATTIVKYLEANPSRLADSGQALASQALTEAYPCTQEEAN